MEASAQETRDAAVLDGARDIAYGSAAGMVSKVFEHPFDLCKVRLQAQVLDHTARFRGPVDCLAATWRNEGVRGLYRGLPAPVVGAMAENATLFLTYGQLQRLARWLSGAPPGAGELRSSQLAFAAAGAGAVTSFLLTPIELIKCKMQVQLLVREVASPASSASSAAAAAALGLPSPAPARGAPPAPDFRSFPGPLGVLRSVVRAHGARGLWLGQTGTLIRETGGAVAWFGAKEAVAGALLRRRSRAQESESLLTSRDLRAWESAAAGACAGVAYNVVLFPADSVKSALQTAEELRPPRAPGAPRRTFWGVAREMYARRGVRGLYAGLGITTARAAPSSAMIFLIYDGLSKRFG